MEMIGPGPGGKGAHWVALKIPDGYISAHANQSRIGEFPLMILKTVSIPQTSSHLRLKKGTSIQNPPNHLISVLLLILLNLQPFEPAPLVSGACFGAVPHL